jgi:hypothetical protein
MPHIINNIVKAHAVSQIGSPVCVFTSFIVRYAPGYVHGARNNNVNRTFKIVHTVYVCFHICYQKFVHNSSHRTSGFIELPACFGVH